jgi:hypothetical protein
MFVFSIVFMKIIENALLEEFELSKKEPSKVFEFYTTDFKLNIISVKLRAGSLFDWQSLLLKFQLKVHVLCQSLEYLGPIHLFIDYNTNQPTFVINKWIDRHVFESDINLAKSSSVQVKIELITEEIINEPFSLHFEIKKLNRQ